MLLILASGSVASASKTSKTKRTPDAGGKSASGYFPGGRYVYEKTFELGEEASEKHITFEFEGVYKNAEVFITALFSNLSNLAHVAACFLNSNDVRNFTYLF